MIQKLNIAIRQLIGFGLAIFLLNTLFLLIFVKPEVFTVVLIHTLITLKFALIVGTLPVIITLIHRKTGQVFSYIYFTLTLLIELLLLLYFEQTGILLGADFFGYSPGEIRHTIQASSSFSIFPWLLFAVSLTSYYLITIKLKTYDSQIKKWPWITLLIASIVSCFIPLDINQWVRTENTYVQAQNPSYHFWQSAIQLLFEDQTASVGINDYPFLHELKNENALNEWLNPGDSPPNIIMIAVEGLGAEFTGTKAKYGGAMTFLDSLAKHSLYWKNCLSNSGRTFGALPSIMGSLPYGNSGFMDLGADMPDHYTLFSLLKPTYHSSFFYGGDSHFDNQDVFLEYQGIDDLLDMSDFPASAEKMVGNAEGYSWGFGDKDLFSLASDKLSETSKTPQISFIMTLTTHEPFNAPAPIYDNWAARRMKENKAYMEFPEVFSCLAYTDDAIRKFINQFAKRPDFKNTIFIITGDHRLIPIPADHRFDRFRVPLIIYSPLIKSPRASETIVAHSQLAPTISAHLKTKYQMNMPLKVGFISDPIAASIDFSSSLDLALIRNKNEIKEYVFGTYLYSNERAYNINPNMSLSEIKTDSMSKFLKKKLSFFNQKSNKAISQNQLVDVSNFNVINSFFKFSRQEQQVLDSLNTIGMSPDSIYYKARELAFNKNYRISRMLLKHGLNQSPNYHDMRIMLARTYAWDNKYDTAYYYLNETMNRNKNLEDAYIAYSDLTFWDQMPDSSLYWVQKGLKSFPNSNELLARKGRAYFDLNQMTKAKAVLDSVLKKDPNQVIARQVSSWIQKSN